VYKSRNPNIKENLINENKKSFGKDANVLLPLINPQKTNQSLPYEWELGKKRKKKKSNRLNS
jgi:hypothetical protein